MTIAKRHTFPLFLVMVVPFGVFGANAEQGRGLRFALSDALSPPSAGGDSLATAQIAPPNPATPTLLPTPASPPTSPVAVTAPPREYACVRTKIAPTLDGKLDDAGWIAAPWTEDFLDIQGPALSAPRFRTRAKMLWDTTHFYIAAELREPHLWATLKTHDEIVFHDNDFEVFIDPDGDSREYYEIEVNALGTIFDLYLHKRYKEDGPAEHAWNAEGLRTAIHLDGTLNDPTDTDRAWTLEWAIPWSAFKPPELPLPSFSEKTRAAAAPKAGEVWRVNFSRVQWTTTLEGKTASQEAPALPINDSYTQPAPPIESAPGTPAFPYQKVPGKPEDNWVWSPQWQIDMHDPKYWGKVKFVDTTR